MKEIEQERQEDIDKIRIINLCEKMGYDATISDAYHIWSTYSESVCAGWIMMPASDSEIWNLIEIIILDMLEEEKISISK